MTAATARRAPCFQTIERALNVMSLNGTPATWARWAKLIGAPISEVMSAAIAKAKGTVKPVKPK